MKKSFMTRVLAVSLSAAMAFSMSSASNLMTASAASTVNLKTTFKTLKVNQTYQLTLKNNTLGWKITKVTTSNKSICTVYNKKASSVMLKGKGVGRAKIQVKVKTTKRKYPKNIKIMTCTANVKAASNPDTPVVDAFSATATALSKGQVRVQFNKAVDDASDASAFKVSGGVTVTKSEQAADKMSTVITMDGAESGKTYDLTVSGMKVNGETQADLKLNFTTPADDAIATGYELKVTPADSIVKCDGQHQTRVTFELLTKDGQAVTDKNVQIQFSASVGTFADSRVTLDGGKATVQYNAPQLNAGTTAGIHATVVEADNKQMIGTVGTGSITLSPNPDSLVSEAAILTSAAAGTADRVIAYFDKEVTPGDFMTKGKPDKNKFTCTIRSRVDNTFVNDGQGVLHRVVAILPVDGEKNALEFLVDSPMIDNSNVSMTFKDKRKTSNTIDTTNTVYFRLADAREPSALNVTTSGTKKITITFSEAVAPQNPDGQNGANSAWNLNNYLIDGRSLADWGVRKSKRDDGSEKVSTSNNDLDTLNTKSVVDSETLDVADGELVLKAYSVDSKGEGTDNRAVVEITVGSGHPLTVGNHQLTVRNVGDWASFTDGARNSVSTQIFPFSIEDNTDKPSFTVDVQSPEQYELAFNAEFRMAENGDRFTTENSKDNPSVLKLQENINGTWTDITVGENNGQNPIRVTRVSGSDNKKYLVEVKRDWSEVYNQESTRTSYYSKQLRLHVDGGKLVNINNNLRNDSIDIYLNADDANVTNGQKMKEQDVISPTIVGVTQATAGGQLVESWNVELSEPVKISADANQEGLTPSQRQQDGIASGSARENEGVPVPYAEFISVENPSVRIEGIIKDDKKGFIDAYDKVINVKPERSLSGGQWRLVVGSISDDYGTVLATSENTITVDTVTTSTDFQIVWAAVADGPNYDTAHVGETRGSYVFVKFSKPVDQAAALNTNNYTLNNATLPHGSYILANIDGYDNHDSAVDSVTIVLPRGGNIYQDYEVDGKNAVLSVTGVTALGTGEELSNGGMNTMPLNIVESVVDAVHPQGGDNAQMDANFMDPRYDAVWGNARAELKQATESWDEYFGRLRDALDDPKYRKVYINYNIFDGVDLEDASKESDELKAAKNVFGSDRVLKINRAVNIDLQEHTINGNVEVNTSDVVGRITIKNGVINGAVKESKAKDTATLIVNAGNVKEFLLEDVELSSGSNKHAAVLNNVWQDSFRLAGNTRVGGNVLVNDTDGFGMEVDRSAAALWNGNLLINSNGVINLKGDFTDRNIFVKQSATVNFGTFRLDGETVRDLNPVTLSGAKIVAEASDTLLKLTRATQIDVNDKADITVKAKNVKVYVEDGYKDLADGTLINYYKDKGGSILAVNEYGRELAADSTATKVTANVQAEGIQRVFQDLNVIDGLATGDYALSEPIGDNKAGSYTYNYDFNDVVSGSAFIYTGDIKADCENRIGSAIAGLELRDANGDLITAADVDVSVRLTGTPKLFRLVDNRIRLVDSLPTTNATDTISITLRCDGYSFTKNIKVTRVQ